MQVMGDELTETRVAFQRELELLKKRGTELAELNFILEGEISDRDSRIRTLEARLSIYECPVAPDAGGPVARASGLLNAPEDQL